MSLRNCEGAPLARCVDRRHATGMTLTMSLEKEL